MHDASPAELWNLDLVWLVYITCVFVAPQAPVQTSIIHGILWTARRTSNIQQWEVNAHSLVFDGFSGEETLGNERTWACGSPAKLLLPHAQRAVTGLLLAL